MNKIFSRIFLVLTVGCVLLIFTNSLMSSETSDKISNFFAEKSAFFLRRISGSIEQGEVSTEPVMASVPAATPVAQAADEEDEPWITQRIKEITNGYFSLFYTETAGDANATMRKMAHFSEFLALSVFFSLFCITGLRQKFRYCIIYVLFFTLLTAVTDEFLQTFADSRGPRVADALIDLSGAAIGLLAVCGLRLLFMGAAAVHKRFSGGGA